MATINDVARVLKIDDGILFEHFNHKVEEEEINGVKVWAVSSKDNFSRLSLTFNGKELDSALFYSRVDLRWGVWQTKHQCSWQAGSGDLSDFVDCLINSIK